MSKTRTFTVSWLVVAAALAITGGQAVAGNGTGGSAACSAVAPGSATTVFASLGDPLAYIGAPNSSGSAVLSNGSSVATDCTRTPGIQATVRFYARSVGGTGAIHVEVIVNRGRTVLDGGLVTAGSTLAPVTSVAIPWDCAGRSATAMQVRLTAVGGDFEIGAIYIDPYLQK